MDDNVIADRLARIEWMHQPDRNCDGCGGNSGYCVECGWAWPCATAETASGERDDELVGGTPSPGVSAHGARTRDALVAPSEQSSIKLGRGGKHLNR